MQFQVGILAMHCPPNRCLSWICYLRIFPEYQIRGKVPVALRVWFIHATSCGDNNMQRSGIYSHNLQWQHDGCLWWCASLNCNPWRCCWWITEDDMIDGCLASLIESGGVLDWFFAPCWVLLLKWEVMEMLGITPHLHLHPLSFLFSSTPRAKCFFIDSGILYKAG